MHGVGVGMSEAAWVRHVRVYSEVGIKTPNPPPSLYSVETQDITYMLSLSLY